MLYRKNGEWALCPYIVKYEQRGKVHEQYTHDKRWWKDLEELHDHTEIIEFKDAEHTDEQKGRLEEVKNLGEGFGFIAEQYVKNDLFPDELEGEEKMINHPLKGLQRQKENEKQGQLLTEMELASIEQGQKQTDIELRLLMLEVEAN